MKKDTFIEDICVMIKELSYHPFMVKTDNQTSEVLVLRIMITDLMELVNAYEVPIGQRVMKEADNHRNYNVGASDYATRTIQPWDIWLEYSMNPWDADIQKRLIRNKVEPGMDSIESRKLDYEKIKHICDERIAQLNNGDPYYE